MISKLENEKIKIEVDSKGAQLHKLILKKDNKNYLWNGDPEYWGRRAPILFPIVGRLKENQYYFNGKKYEMSQHGFARDKDFKLKETQSKSLTYQLKEDENTLEIYPFKFTLEVEYSLKENSLLIDYRVLNTDQKDLYFSIGAHPGFFWPLEDKEKKKDYYLEFEKKETTSKYLLEAGLLNNQKKLILDNSKILNLHSDIFKNDALVFKDLKSEKITLKSKKSDREIEMVFKEFPYLGIWSQSAAAPFICLEPWHGIADSVDSSGQLEEKEGIKRLKVGEEFNCNHRITIN